MAKGNFSTSREESIMSRIRAIIKGFSGLALAKFWCATDIAKAWQFAGQVGDFKKRVDTATVVFKEWEKTDKTAATAAWVALFPGK